MSPEKAIEAIGGGLSAVVIVALAIAVVALYRRVNELNDKILDMALKLGRENHDLAMATNATLNRSSDAITRLLEARK